MLIGDERRTIDEGDVFYIPNGTPHVVTNTSHTDPLKFVSIYWLQDARSA